MKNIIDDLIEINGIADMFPAYSNTFKQFQVGRIFNLPVQKPDMEQLLNVTVTVEVLKTNIIETPKGISFEGQILTGKKLIINGRIQQKIEYISDDPLQSVHAAHFIIPFSSYIVLGSNFACASDFETTGYVEDIYVKQVDKRKIIMNVILLLNAVPQQTHSQLGV